MSLVDLPEGVKLCELTKQKTYALWDKVKNYEVLFSDDIRWSVVWFFERMWNEETVVLETEGGLLILTGVKPNAITAGVHIIFWDHKLSARTELFKECLVWAFLQFGFYRLEALIPEFCRGLQRFMQEKLKFVCEGRMRDRILYKGQLADVKIYSILRKEM